MMRTTSSREAAAAGRRLLPPLRGFAFFNSQSTHGLRRGLRAGAAPRLFRFVGKDKSTRPRAKRIATIFRQHGGPGAGAPSFYCRGWVRGEANWELLYYVMIRVKVNGMLKDAPSLTFHVTLCHIWNARATLAFVGHLEFLSSTAPRNS